MKKTLLISLLASASLFAAPTVFNVENYVVSTDKNVSEPDYVIGLSGGLGTSNIKVDTDDGITSTSESSKENYNYLNFRVGKISSFKGHEFRTTLNYAKFNTKKDIDKMNKYSLDIDYAITKYPYEKVRPFIGASLYHLTYELNDGTNHNDTGLGLQAGVNYFLTKHFNAEVGYKFNFLNSKVQNTSGGTTTVVEMQDLNQLYVGINYRF